MTVNPTTNIDLTASFQAKPEPQREIEQNKVHQVEANVAADNDSDDQSVKPSVNTSGQTIGTIVNTKA